MIKIFVDNGQSFHFMYKKQDEILVLILLTYLHHYVSVCVLMYVLASSRIVSRIILFRVHFSLSIVFLTVFQILILAYM